MQLLGQTLRRLSVAQPVRRSNLSVFPLLDPAPHEAEYLTFGQAVDAGLCRLTEVSDHGSVPDLRLVNLGEKPVFLLDGEELIGAKQNRVINLTVLAPGERELRIPVSCVEQGRWHYDTPEFQSSPRTMYPSARARKTAQVSRSMEHGSRRADQGAVWQDIAAKSARMAAVSATGAMSDLFEQHESTISSYTQRVRPAERQVGAVFAIGEQVLGLELFDAPSTLAAYLSKLIRGYALDAMDLKTRRRVERGETIPDAVGEAEVTRFIDEVAECPVRPYPALGLGTDLRLEHPPVSGAALQLEDRLVHLVAFRSEPDAEYLPPSRTRAWEQIRRRRPRPRP